MEEDSGIKNITLSSLHVTRIIPCSAPLILISSS